MYKTNKAGIHICDFYEPYINYINNIWFGDNSIIKDIYHNRNLYTRYINMYKFGINIEIKKKTTIICK
jgi:hypothetical protein